MFSVRRRSLVVVGVRCSTARAPVMACPDGGLRTRRPGLTSFGEFSALLYATCLILVTSRAMSALSRECREF